MLACECFAGSSSLQLACFGASLDIVGLMSSGLTPGLTPETVYSL